MPVAIHLIYAHGLAKRLQRRQVIHPKAFNGSKGCYLTLAHLIKVLVAPVSADVSLDLANGSDHIGRAHFINSQQNPLVKIQCQLPFTVTALRESLLD